MSIQLPDAALRLREKHGNFEIAGGWIRRAINGTDNSTCDIDIIKRAGFRGPLTAYAAKKFGPRYFDFAGRKFNLLSFSDINEFDFTCCQVALDLDGNIRAEGDAIRHINDKRIVASKFTLTQADKQLTKVWPRIAKFIREGYTMHSDDLAALCGRWAAVHQEDTSS